MALVSGCRRGADDEGGRGAASASASAASQAEGAEGAQAEPPADTGRYARSLEQQLDLVPPDGDGFLVVRDLRPLVAQARIVEALMAGPLRRAIPALAELGGGTGEQRLAELAQARELLGLVLTGIEGAGIELESGLVVALTQAGPIVAFAATDIDKVLALAALVSEAGELGDACRKLDAGASWHACSLAGPEALAGYAPAGQGRALAERLRARVGLGEGTDELAAVNVALSLADATRPVDAVLRTDPELWELSVPLATARAEADEAPLLEVGPPTALRSWVPGTSFVWGRIDPAVVDARALGLDQLDASLLSGELFFGVHDEPDGLLVQLGTRDEERAIAGVEAMTKLLPAGDMEPAELPGLRLSFDRARLDIDGRSLPSIGVVAGGEAGAGWARGFGLEARGRLWAAGDYLSLAVGKSQAIPAALADQAGAGPSKAALATLPASLADALAGGEVGFVANLVLDHWQAPPSTEELEALLLGLGPETKSASPSIFAAFDVLAPWSTLALWARRATPASAWSLSLSLVPFTAPAGVGAEERAAVEAALAKALAGADAGAEQAYRELAARFADSVHASRYRARAGEAPRHHAAVGSLELGLLAAFVVPIIERQLQPPASSEAPAQTQSILAAALTARQQAGRCRPLVGKAGPTPPLNVSCLTAAGGRCQPSEDLDAPDGEGRYPLTAWTEDPLWGAIDYKMASGTSHRAHYSLEIVSRGGGCEIAVLAEVELEPGTYATYRRAATVERDETTALIPLEIGTRSE